MLGGLWIEKRLGLGFFFLFLSLRIHWVQVKVFGFVISLCMVLDLARNSGTWCRSVRATLFTCS
jgi:hypothetical protein